MGAAASLYGPAAHEERERDFGEEEMKNEGMGCQMKDFLPF